MFDPKDQSPFDIFDQWMKEAEREEPNNPNAMCLSTVSTNGKPLSYGLLKDYSENSFTFLYVKAANVLQPICRA